MLLITALSFAAAPTDPVRTARFRVSDHATLARPRQSARIDGMDLRPVREQAIEATARFFWDKQGFLPDEDSEEWEREYRRQFELVRRNQETSTPAAARPVEAPAPDEAGWVPLRGAPTETRWAAALRTERIREIRDPGVRQWLTTTWTRSKSWIDMRELPTSVFLERIRPHYLEYRKAADERAQAEREVRQAQAAAAADLRREIETRRISAEGLVELVDIAERLPTLPLATKIAELEAGERHLRVFETADPAVLMVLERNAVERSEYGIERDEGLVADLLLFARAQALV
jgi:hypothetical protein